MKTELTCVEIDRVVKAGGDAAFEYAKCFGKWYATHRKTLRKLHEEFQSESLVKMDEHDFAAYLFNETHEGQSAARDLASA